MYKSRQLFFSGWIPLLVSTDEEGSDKSGEGFLAVKNDVLVTLCFDWYLSIDVFCYGVLWYNVSCVSVWLIKKIYHTINKWEKWKTRRKVILLCVQDGGGDSQFNITCSVLGNCGHLVMTSFAVERPWNYDIRSWILQQCCAEQHPWYIQRASTWEHGVHLENGTFYVKIREMAIFLIGYVQGSDVGENQHKSAKSQNIQCCQIIQFVREYQKLHPILKAYPPLGFFDQLNPRIPWQGSIGILKRLVEL